jgi:hypothetical protein
MKIIMKIRKNVATKFVNLVCESNEEILDQMQLGGTHLRQTMLLVAKVEVLTVLLDTAYERIQMLEAEIPLRYRRKRIRK